MPEDKHDDKQDASFRVIDRRLFSTEGELRPDVLEEKTAEEARAAKPPEPERKAGAPSAAKDGMEPSPVSAPGAPEVPRPSRSFQAIISILAQNAELFLGGFPDPRTGQPVVNLDGAREMIEMLDALREKSRGNLAPDEDRLLLDVIGSLKLTYMEISKAATAAVRENPTLRSK